MSTELIVRPVQVADTQAWLVLWRDYCAELDGDVSDEITEGVWQRILAPEEPVWCLVACNLGSEPMGFANYVLHPHTWSLRSDSRRGASGSRLTQVPASVSGIQW